MLVKNLSKNNNIEQDIAYKNEELKKTKEKLAVTEIEVNSLKNEMIILKLFQ